MNSNDIETNSNIASSGINNGIGEGTPDFRKDSDHQLDNAMNMTMNMEMNMTMNMDMNDDDFDIYEINSYSVTPVNNTLKDYLVKVGYEVLNDYGKTTKANFGMGENRGNPSLRYKDMVILYNYLYTSLKSDSMRDLLVRIYGDVISDQYSKTRNIAFSALQALGYVPTALKEPKECAGYVITAHRYEKEAYLSYGYVCDLSNLVCYPFNDGYEKTIGKVITISRDLKNIFCSMFKVDEKATPEDIKNNRTKCIDRVFKLITKKIKENTKDVGFTIQFDTNNIIDYDIDSFI